MGVAFLFGNLGTSEILDARYSRHSTGRDALTDSRILRAYGPKSHTHGSEVCGLVISSVPES